MTVARAECPNRDSLEQTPWGALSARSVPVASSPIFNDLVHQSYLRFVASLPTSDQAEQAATLNDEARAGLESRCVVLASKGFAGLPEADRRQIRLLVSTKDNGDAHLVERAERDFGAVYQHVDGEWTTDRLESPALRETVLWMIDRFDLTFSEPAQCPWDRASTAHVLSLTLASEI